MAAVAGFLLANPVSLTSGTKIVNVTGSVNCSYVVSGTAVFIDGILMEGVEGTDFDVNGDSTITLRNDYTGTSITGGQLVSFNTIEGLRDSIEAAKDLVDNAVNVQATFHTLLVGTTETVDITVNDVVIPMTPYQYLANQVSGLVDSASDADDVLSDLTEAVELLQTTTDNIQGVLDGKVVLATTGAETAVTKAGEASTSAENASTSEGNAATSESNAATSESNAGTSESNAGTSASNAATSESNAGTSASNAGTSESNAATSEGNAATSESNAGTSESNAATSESNAATSEGIASTAATQAAANANYKGEWSLLSGALNVPASVKNLDVVYMLNTNLTQVQNSEPTGVNTDWFVLGSVTGISPNSERLGGELPIYYLNPDNMDDSSSTNKWVSSAEKIAWNSKAESSREINGNPLTSDFNLTFSDVGALADGGTAADSSLLTGLAPTDNDTGSTIVRRDINGDIKARLFRMTWTPTNSDVSCIITQSSSTDSLQPSTPAQLKASLSLPSTNVANTFTNDQKILGGSTGLLTLQKDVVGSAAGLAFNDHNGNKRWELYEDNDVDVDLVLRSKNSSGVTIGDVFTVDNTTREVRFNVVPKLAGNLPFHEGHYPEITEVDGLSSALSSKADGTATTTELNLKADKLDFTNVDNTADLDKPTSTATAAALGLKADTTVTDDLQSQLIKTYKISLAGL